MIDSILRYKNREAWNDVTFELIGEDPLGKVTRDFMFEESYKAYMMVMSDSDESIDTLDIVRVEYHVQPDYDYFPNVIVLQDRREDTAEIVMDVTIDENGIGIRSELLCVINYIADEELSN